MSDLSGLSAQMAFFDEGSETAVQFRENLEFMAVDMGNFYYGIELNYVKELVRDPHITPVPCLPSYYEGVCNWKGNIIPVVSMRAAGGLPREEVSQKLVLIAKAGGLECGFLVAGEPAIVGIAPDRELTGELPEDGGIMLAVKQAFEGEDKIISVVDVDKSLKKMVVFE
ncbi:chemotaxis protein CheW [uncultured Clostridium sp.]|uniref:chemotaxis protein CheW n=1 Tax=uncultured Clostridium sp. TaxID=59620 RepID=UPI0025DCCE54|nr:CheW domain-containing protein [uncultured Clostridium sp.]